MRIILCTGKGGVGKTCVAASTALRASDLGHKTLVMSTDSAHSLSDSFDLSLSGEPTTVRKNLWGQEIDVEREIKENWELMQKYLSAVLSFHGLDKVVADEMAVFPGMEELFSLVKIKEYHDQKSYEVVIVDCAPTASTLRLLSFPDMARWYIRNLFPIQRKAAKAFRPLVQRMTPMPLPDDDVFASTEELYQKISNIKDIISDGSKTSIRIVLNPEKMVIKEAQRGFTYFNLFGFSVDAIIANRVLPDEVKGTYFGEWRNIQEGHLKSVEECFSPVPILPVKLFDREIVGLKLLAQMAKSIYGNRDPTQVFYHKKPVEITREKNGYVLSLNLPFVEKDDLDIIKNGDELTIRAGRHKRNILLPRALAALDPVGAKFEADQLRIEFAENR